MAPHWKLSPFWNWQLKPVGMKRGALCWLSPLAPGGLPEQLIPSTPLTAFTTQLPVTSAVALASQVLEKVAQRVLQFPLSGVM